MNSSVQGWVNEIVALCKPDQVYWCDGSEAEHKALTEQAVKEGVLIPLNQEKMPGCYYHRSHPSDVARTEHLTFICTPNKDDTGPTNNWMAPDEAKAKLSALFAGAMAGRTLYVVPFLMGPPGSPFSKVGIEITDSVYVALNMRIMTRMGKAALDHLGDSDDFTRCLHSLGDLSPDRRYICHFPDDNAVWSIGSGYGGNALLGKKCLALRLASVLGRKEGWLAEHMLIVGIENPQGEVHYVLGAFPSACGKTNLAMLKPPASMPGWKVWTVGDDIAWLRVGEDGRLWAVNPEAGFFGVVPGTNTKTNTNAMAAIATNTIYTNVALADDGTVWWEGHDAKPPAHATNWQGQPWTPESKDKGAHPNSRFTAPAAQCPTISLHWQDIQGVPISAILFGSRRATAVPLITESKDWAHGTYLGATIESETTAAATGAVGVVRRDPMAMLPFCGYNMGDYFAHWLDMGEKVSNPPKIFRVNWFRTGSDGKFLWPGFGENLRVIEWALKRCEGKASATESALGYHPSPEDFDFSASGLSAEKTAELMAVNAADWQASIEGATGFFDSFGARCPQGLRDQHEAFIARLK